MSDSMQPHGLKHARVPCPSQTPRAYSNSYPLSRWCHPTISSSVIPFSSRLQSFPASGSFQMSQFFTSGGQSIGILASASVLPMNIQDWFPLGLSKIKKICDPKWNKTPTIHWKAISKGCLQIHRVEALPRLSVYGQGGLACCGLWGHKELDTTEQLNWTELTSLNY